MCGKCEEGYSESMFSPGCIKDEECNSASWFLVVVAIYGIVYVIFFICQEEIEYFAHTFVIWAKELITRKKKNQPATDNSSLSQSLSLSTVRPIKEVRFASDYHDYFNHNLASSQQGPTLQQPKVPEPDSEEAHDSALLQIFMYYVQVSGLLKISILYQNAR